MAGRGRGGVATCWLINGYRFGYLAGDYELFWKPGDEGAFWGGG